jgi:hypothetical protein
VRRAKTSRRLEPSSGSAVAVEILGIPVAELAGFLQTPTKNAGVEQGASVATSRLLVATSTHDAYRDAPDPGGCTDETNHVRASCNADPRRRRIDVRGVRPSERAIACQRHAFEPQNAYFFELLGAAPYSINFDRRQFESVSFRAGFSYVKSFDALSNARAVVFPQSNFGQWAGRNHHFEFGGGPTPGERKISGRSEFLLAANATAGYRYQPSGGGFFFRAIGGGLVFFWPTPVEGGPTIGVSFGYTH